MTVKRQSKIPLHQYFKRAFRTNETGFVPPPPTQKKIIMIFIMMTFTTQFVIKWAPDWNLEKNLKIVSKKLRGEWQKYTSRHKKSRLFCVNRVSYILTTYTKFFK